MSEKEQGVLGRAAPIPPSPGEARLVTVPNPHPDTAYVARFTCPEFTSLCPVTGQPDFAHLVIDYIPDARIVREGGYEGAGLQQYFLPGPFTENLGAEIKAIVTKALDSLAKQDAQRLRTILRMDPEELCRRQCQPRK